MATTMTGKPTDAQLVGRRIVEARSNPRDSRSALTQGQLAKALGIQRNQLSDWERGEHEPRRPTLRQIGKLTGYPLDHFYQDLA